MWFPALIEVRPSRQLRILLCAVHVVPATAFGFSGLGIGWILAVLILLTGSLVRSWQTAARARFSLLLEESGELELHRREGHERPASRGTLRDGTSDFRWAIWLQIALEAPLQPRSSAAAPSTLCRRDQLNQILLSDQLSADDWRTLRIWLRHRAPRGKQPAQ